MYCVFKLRWLIALNHFKKKENGIVTCGAYRLPVHVVLDHATEILAIKSATLTVSVTPPMKAIVAFKAKWAYEITTSLNQKKCLANQITLIAHQRSITHSRKRHETLDDGFIVAAQTHL